MRNSLLLSALLAVFATPAHADLKPGQFAGVRKCTGSSGGTDIDVTSKKTIGVATCKGELQRELVARGVCNGKPKHAKVEYSFKFGDDKDPNQATGSHYVLCRG
jgi:hypothetical protein